MPATASGLNILAVDDSRGDLTLVSTMLTKMGHAVIPAQSGEEALEVFRQRMPDLVLIDVIMPGMGGLEAVRQMRQLAHGNWIPIIFITGMESEESVVQGIEAGGDDYLLKPINYKILHAKVHALIEHLRLFRQMETQSQLLLSYQARIESEQLDAQEFMGRLLALDRINDPLVQFHLQPAETFSGDLIAVARSPAGHLYAMLADSSGHGLTSALAVMPVLQTFHSMAAKGFSIGKLAAEINRKIREYLPAHRFVAAVLVALDLENGRLSVWNGGCLPAILLAPDNAIAFQFESTHLPLGILSPQKFDDEVAHYHYGDRPFQLLICSDGAVDCLDNTCAKSGVARLLEAAAAAPPGDRLSHMMRLMQQVNWKQAHDDVALILIDCPPATDAASTAASAIPVTRPLAAAMLESGPSTKASANWTLDLTLSAQQLRQTDIVPLLMHIVQQVEFENSAGLSGKIFLVLSELFNNALDHGVLGLDSSLKNAQGMDRYFDERARRLAQLEKGEIRIRLATASAHGPCLHIVITDSGEGFDFQSLQQPALAPDMRRHGRGIALVESMSGSLRYTANGRSAHACIPLQNPEQCVSTNCKDTRNANMGLAAQDMTE